MNKMTKSKKRNDKHNSKNNKNNKNNNKSNKHVKQTGPSATFFPPSLLTTTNKGKHPHKTKPNQTPTPISISISISTLIPSAVFTSQNFLTSEECKSWIKHAEETIGFQQMSNPQTREYAHRECGRIQINDWNMAQLLYNRMKPFLDQLVSTGQVTVPNSNCEYKPVGCNGNIRIYKYEKNMSFGRHYDGSNAIPRFLGGNTEITVLIYLSSCEGGATRFHLPHKKKQRKKGKQQGSKKQKTASIGQGGDDGGGGDDGNNNSNDDGNGIAFVPKEGSILMHMHGDRCLEHEADPVLNGIKYILRTDIVYANSDESLDQ
jgi:hypothetical protein